MLISSEKSLHRTERDQLAHREQIQFAAVNLFLKPGGDCDIKLITSQYPEGKEADIVLLERKQKLFGSFKSFSQDFLFSY